MTVEELIEELKKIPKHYIVITHQGNYSDYDRIADGVKFPGGAKILITNHVADEE